jgi:predicted membrane protein
MAKSANSLVYNRSVQKISSVFSFMGGMIGAVSAVLFIIKIYTRLSFEISIAFEIFRPEE